MSDDKMAFELDIDAAVEEIGKVSARKTLRGRRTAPHRPKEVDWQERGKAIPVQMSIRMSPQAYIQFRDMCEKHHLSNGAMVEELMESHRELARLKKTTSE